MNFQTIILQEQGLLTGVTYCHCRIFLIGISCITACCIFCHFQNNLGQTNRDRRSAVGDTYPSRMTVSIPKSSQRWNWSFKKSGEKKGPASGRTFPSSLIRPKTLPPRWTGSKKWPSSLTRSWWRPSTRPKEYRCVEQKRFFLGDANFWPLFNKIRVKRTCVEHRSLSGEFGSIGQVTFYTP